MKMAQVSKGRRMLGRVMPLLGHREVPFVVYAFIRNLRCIVTSPTTKEVLACPLAPAAPV